MNELRLKAKSLKDEKKYVDAIEIYEQIYSDSCDKWIAWEYSYCLKQVGRIDGAIDICRTVYNSQNSFKFNNDLLGWLLYEKYFKQSKEVYTYDEVNKLYDISIFIPKLISQESTTAYDKIILKMLKIVKKHCNNPNDKLLILLNLLDPKRLLDTPHFYVDESRQKEYQSDKEMYYAYKTKVLYSVGSYLNCIDCCDEAKKTISTFHHNNDIWIDVRRALSIAEIDDNLSGIAELKSISAKKPHWTIFAEIAKLHNKVSDKDNALLNYFRAAITMEPSKMKVTLYYDIYKLLYDNDQQEWANLHALFVINIRESEGWSLNNELQQIKDNTKHDENDIKNLERKLRVFWLEKIHCLLNAQNGIITNINKNGKFGFIKGRTKSYYFQRQSVIQNKRINENDKVKFCVIDSFDFKKRQRTEEAAYIILDN